MFVCLINDDDDDDGLHRLHRWLYNNHQQGSMLLLLLMMVMMEQFPIHLIDSSLSLSSIDDSMLMLMTMESM